MAQAGGSAVMAAAAVVAVVAITMVATIFPGADAASGSTTFNVGAGNGWTLPASPAGGYNYSDWASGYTYHVGDKLFFSYKPGAHNVLSVTGPNYAACTFDQPLFNDNGAGNTTFPLDKPGNYWFVCSVGGGRHCQAGMKFKVSVSEASAAGLSTGSVARAVPALLAALALVACFVF